MISKDAVAQESAQPGSESRVEPDHLFVGAVKKNREQTKTEIKKEECFVTLNIHVLLPCDLKWILGRK